MSHDVCLTAHSVYVSYIVAVSSDQNKLYHIHLILITPETHALKNKLQVAQNKTVRFIKSMGPRASIKQAELSSLGFLNIKNRVKQLRLNHAHKIYYDKCPSYLKNYFIKINEHHVHNTRSSQINYVTPKIKGIESTTFSYNGIHDWNSLPDSIKSINDLQRFKKEVKCLLMHTSEERERRVIS